MCDGDGQPPNPLVCVSINTLPSVKWTRFAQTEIVEPRHTVRRRNVNFDYEARDDPIEDPTLKNKAEFYFFTLDKAINAFESTFDVISTDSNYFQFLYNICDLKGTPQNDELKYCKDLEAVLTDGNSSDINALDLVIVESTLLGESVFTLENLLQSHHRTLRLTLVSPSCASVGFISISAREMSNTKQRNAWLLLAEEESLWSKVERPRSYSLPSRLTSQVGIPVLGLLKTLSNNFVTQTYRFHTGLGAELHVHEIMAERVVQTCGMCAAVWHGRVVTLPLEWQQKYLAATDGHLRLVNHYTEVVDFLLKQKGSSFKPSIKKKDTNFEFVPVNLHVQRMWVQNVTTRKTGVYDIITVGAFSAYSRRFRQGGLLRLLNQLKSCYPLFSGDNGSAILGPDPISRSAEAIMRIEQLQEEIESDLKKIISLCDQKYKPTVQAVLNSLSSKHSGYGHELVAGVIESRARVLMSLKTCCRGADAHQILWLEILTLAWCGSKEWYARELWCHPHHLTMVQNRKNHHVALDHDVKKLSLTVYKS
ncbi:hypothetical protein TNCV_5037081 [Trichonephila clavipes]|nr:hypothetical protein TNCV_5037081 [Trichonephila clavipes]